MWWLLDGHALDSLKSLRARSVARLVEFQSFNNRTLELRREAAAGRSDPRKAHINNR